MLNVREKRSIELPIQTDGKRIEQTSIAKEPSNVGEARQLVGGGGKRVASRTKVGRMVQAAIRRASSIAGGVLVAGLLAGSIAAPAQAQIVTRDPQQAVAVHGVAVQNLAEARQAVLEVKALHERGKLERLFERDPNTGAYVHQAEHDVLRRLPVIGPETTPEQLLAYGLIDAVPRGLADLHRRDRYFVGKQVFVRTTTSDDKNDWGKFQAGGTSRITHRGTIRAIDRDAFVVEVPKASGGKESIRVSKEELLELNQPSSPDGATSTVNGIEIDYSDPVARGKIAQGFFLIARDLARLDFTKPVDDRTNREARLAIVHQLFWNQHSEYVESHHKDWQQIGSMSNVLNGGVGVCTVQGTTQWGYLQPFEQIAGFALLNVDGSTIDLDRGHNFNILWLLGSEEMFVTDRTWNGGNEHVPIDRAMGAQGWNQNRYMVGPNGSR
jgi:hypothetical protein